MEEDKDIDKSQWLPLKTVKEYAEVAINKGRKFYNNGAIVSDKKDKMPIDRLFEDESILDVEQYEAGVKFKILCDCAEGRVSSRGVTEPEESPIDPVLKKALIYYQLTKKQAYYVDRILFATIKEHDYGWIRTCKVTIQDAFDALANAMKKENILKSIDKRRDSAKLSK